MAEAGTKKRNARTRSSADIQRFCLVIERMVVCVVLVLCDDKRAKVTLSITPTFCKENDNCVDRLMPYGGNDPRYDVSRISMVQASLPVKRSTALT
jgi:hypothetical protein